MSPSTFTYDTLPSERSIRLFGILSGTGDEVRCVFNTYALDDCPDFDIISLDWESSSETAPLLLNDTVAQVPAAILPALRRFRSSMTLSATKFWAECICVNREADEERSTQLRLLRDIGKKAGHGHIWLGDEETEHAKHIVSKILSATQILFENIGDRWGNYADSSEAMMDFGRKSAQRAKQGRPHLFTYGWAEVNEMFSRPWFSRRRSIEEIAWTELTMLHFGIETIGYQPIFRMATVVSSLFEHTGDQIPVDMEALGRDALMASYKRLALGLPGPDRSVLHRVSVLRATALCRFECIDPRDYLFRIAGLMGENPVNEHAPLPDYSKSWPEVFTDFTIWALQRDHDLLNLSITSESAPELPSWVPNYSKIDRALMMALPINPFISSGKGGSPELSFSQDRRLLTFKARIVDKITAANPAMMDEKEPDVNDDLPIDRPGLERLDSDASEVRMQNAVVPKIARIISWLEGCITLAESGHESPDSFVGISPERFDQLWQTLTMDYWADRDSGRTVDDYRALFREMLSFYKIRSPENFNTAEFEDAGERLAQGIERTERMEAAVVTENQLMFAQTMKFSVTAQDRLAILNKRAQVGDDICVIPGAQAAHIIRRLPNGRYKFVGECYLHGMMQGQAMELTEVPLQPIELE